MSTWTKPIAGERSCCAKTAASSSPRKWCSTPIEMITSAGSRSAKALPATNRQSSRSSSASRCAAVTSARLQSAPISSTSGPRPPRAASQRTTNPMPQPRSTTRIRCGRRHGAWRRRSSAPSGRASARRPGTLRGGAAARGANGRGPRRTRARSSTPASPASAASDAARRGRSRQTRQDRVEGDVAPFERVRIVVDDQIGQLERVGARGRLMAPPTGRRGRYAAERRLSSGRSDSMRPAPITTDDSGSSATVTGSWVSSRRRRSRLRSSAPPPVIMTPRS